MLDGPAMDEDLNERQARIVARVREQGFVTIDALARDFAVSAQTVRREIIRLDGLGVVRRFHGGAGPGGSGERLPYAAKRGREADLKARIGAAMAKLLRAGETVFLDVGTTAEATAAALAAVQGLRVVTPGAANARILAASPGVEVVLTGGRIAGPDLSLTGPIALRTLAGYRFDWAILACSGIEESGAALDFDMDKIALKQLAMQMAGRKALIADSTKFGKTALIEVARLGDFDIVVTDQTPPPRIARRIAPGALRLA
jgi:DeoR family transcriptional regulator, glycerol-3-phosphate regulon repressor